MAEVGFSSRSCSDSILSSEEVSYLEGLDTGDLVLFNRPCAKMGSLYGGFVCAAAKAVSGSPYDHIGVVVRDRNNRNVIVEAAFSGVTVRELCERVKRSSASQICVREVRIQRTEEMREEARAFVSEIEHLSYRDGGMGFLQMASAALRLDRGKERRRRMHAEAIRLSNFIERLEKEREDESAAKISPASGANGIAMAVARRDELLRRLGSSSSSAAGSSGRSATSSSPRNEGTFCSELVAALYQRLGLLDSSFPPSEDYVPADFAPASVGPSTLRDNDTSFETAGRHRLVLLRGAELSPGRWIHRRGRQHSRSPPSSQASEEPTSRPPVAPGGAQSSNGGAVESVVVGPSGYPVTLEDGGAGGGSGLNDAAHGRVDASVDGVGGIEQSPLSGVFRDRLGSSPVRGRVERETDVDVVDTLQPLAVRQLDHHARHGDVRLLHPLRFPSRMCSDDPLPSSSLPSRLKVSAKVPAIAEVGCNDPWSWGYPVQSLSLMALVVAAASMPAHRAVIPRLARARSSRVGAPWVVSCVVGAAAAAATTAGARDRAGQDR